MPPTSQNAIWKLFSSTAEGILFGQQQYQWNIPNISSIIRVLYKGIKMTYTVEDFKRDLPKEILAMMSDEYRALLIEELSADEMIQHLSPSERIKGLSPGERIKGLSPGERIEGLSPDELVKSLDSEGIKKLSPEQRQRMLDLLAETRQ